MENNNQPPRLTPLCVDYNTLIAQVVRLQHQIVTCESKLVELALANRFTPDQEPAKALHDEIFGYQIEIQSLHKRMSRLKAQTSSP